MYLSLGMRQRKSHCVSLTGECKITNQTSRESIQNQDTGTVGTPPAVAHLVYLSTVPVVSRIRRGIGFPSASQHVLDKLPGRSGGVGCSVRGGNRQRSDTPVNWDGITMSVVKRCGAAMSLLTIVSRVWTRHKGSIHFTRWYPGWT